MLLSQKVLTNRYIMCLYRRDSGLSDYWRNIGHSSDSNELVRKRIRTRLRSCRSSARYRPGDKRVEVLERPSLVNSLYRFCLARNISKLLCF